jgi:hypothetical protein
MKTFINFITEELSVNYNKPDYQRLADEEHNETVYQSEAIKAGHMSDTHPAIAKAIHRFAKNKPAFQDALKNSKIEKVKQGTEVNNSEIGQGLKNVEDKQKVKRVRGMIQKNHPIDRPIILRHKDKNGNVFHHLLAGNTRATAVGYGIEAHHIDV